MMAVIMGVAPDDEAVLDRACDLGMAFQLANIARDLSEDAAAGRCYTRSDSSPFIRSFPWLGTAGQSAATSAGCSRPSPSCWSK